VNQPQAQTAPRSRAVVVRAEIVRRFRLVLVEEPSMRIVARGPRVPERLADRIMAEIDQLLRHIRAAAAVKQAVANVHQVVTDFIQRKKGW
jgi:hypothetical protein